MAGGENTNVSVIETDGVSGAFGIGIGDPRHYTSAAKWGRDCTRSGVAVAVAVGRGWAVSIVIAGGHRGVAHALV